MRRHASAKVGQDQVSGGVTECIFLDLHMCTIIMHIIGVNLLRLSLTKHSVANLKSDY